MSETRVTPQAKPRPVLDAMKLYAFFIASWVVGILLLIVTAKYVHWAPVFYIVFILVQASPLIYLLTGVLCVKKITNRLITWHPVWNTISNRRRFKLKVVCFWPFYLPMLFWDIAISNL